MKKIKIFVIGICYLLILFISISMISALTRPVINNKLNSDNLLKSFTTSSGSSCVYNSYPNCLPAGQACYYDTCCYNYYNDCCPDVCDVCPGFDICPKCNPECEECKQVCEGESCVNSGKKLCENNGRCVAIDESCDCPTPCATCTERCENGVCILSGNKICGNGLCRSLDESCDCPTPCSDCIQKCEGGSCVASGMKKCDDGQCVAIDESCDCPTPCNDCIQKCFLGICIPSGNKKCDDGRCIPSGDSCNCDPPCDYCEQQCTSQGCTDSDYKRCSDGRCILKSADCCIPNCEGKECGDDGCGGSCGICDALNCKSCEEGKCVDKFNCGKWCCAPGEACCSNSVCCNKDIYKCGGGYLLPVYCEAQNCINPREPVHCGVVCCPEGSVCGKTGVKDTCMTGQCSSGTTLCHFDKSSGNSLCCKNDYEDCISGKFGVKGCNPRSCSNGGKLCSGTQDYATLNKCCPRGTYCGLHPQGYPRCQEFPNSPGLNPDSNVNTNSFSIYMFRNPDNFTRSGIAYIFEPHGLTFNKNLSLDFFKYNFWERLYRYENESYLEDCTIDLLSVANKTIGTDGGYFYMEDLLLEIPEYSLLNEYQINVSKVEINCPNYNTQEFFILDSSYILHYIESYYSGEINESNLEEALMYWNTE